MKSVWTSMVKKPHSSSKTCVQDYQSRGILFWKTTLDFDSNNQMKIRKITKN